MPPAVLGANGLPRIAAPIFAVLVAISRKRGLAQVCHHVLAVAIPPRLSCCPGRSLGTWNDINSCGPAISPEDPMAVNNCSTTCCPAEGIWSEWVSTGSLQKGGDGKNLTCGMCATQMQKRKCLSESYGCSCVGLTTQSLASSSDLCVFPYATCCAPYVKKLDVAAKKYSCQSTTTVPAIKTTTCCPPDGNGLWNDWGSWASCSATCGLCGTQSRTRTCASAAYGCPCSGTSTQSQKCGNPACTGTACCGATYQAVSYDGTLFCQETQPAPAVGTWQAWFTTATCNDTCGMCGREMQARYCWPPGTTCTGPFTQEVPCNDTLCVFPRSTCCSPFVKKLSTAKKMYTCQ
ncbi:unnamed protein product, partial [Mesorhabditis spiculigera]